MIYAENEDYKWGTDKFCKKVGYALIYPQILVAEYPFSEKWFFEIAESVTVTFLRVFSKGVKALPGSFVDGSTGKLFNRGTNVPVDFVRLPTLEEIEFYEQHSKL